MYSGEYNSGFSRPAALHPAAPLSPRHEGNVGQASRRISPEIALRLSKALGRTPESWFAMQSSHDLWQAKQHVKLGKVGKV
jgi:antitoxin HigA-1